MSTINHKYYPAAKLPTKATTNFNSIYINTLHSLDRSGIMIDGMLVQDGQISKSAVIGLEKPEMLLDLTNINDLTIRDEINVFI